MTKQVVDFRYGDCYFVTEFVQPENYEVKRIAGSLGCDVSNDEFLVAASNWVRDNITYPLDRSGEPATEGEQKRYKWCWRFLIDKKRYYVWSFPAMVITTGYGYCAESANLLTSLLRAKGILAWTAIGEVRKTSTDSLLGYHAWTVCDYRGEEYVIETTLHSKDNPKILRREAYDKLSDWAEDGDVYYVEHGRYDENNYSGLTDLGKSGLVFQLMGKPWRLIQACGIERIKEISPKKLYKEWRKEEAEKHRRIESAFGGLRW